MICSICPDVLARMLVSRNWMQGAREIEFHSENIK
jgi:hypothetical protein